MSMESRGYSYVSSKMQAYQIFLEGLKLHLSFEQNVGHIKILERWLKSPFELNSKPMNA